MKPSPTRGHLVAKLIALVVSLIAGWASYVLAGPVVKEILASVRAGMAIGEIWTRTGLPHWPALLLAVATIVWTFYWFRNEIGGVINFLRQGILYLSLLADMAAMWLVAQFLIGPILAKPELVLNDYVIGGLYVLGEIIGFIFLLWAWEQIAGRIPNIQSDEPPHTIRSILNNVAEDGRPGARSPFAD